MGHQLPVTTVLGLNQPEMLLLVVDVMVLLVVVVTVTVVLLVTVTVEKITGAQSP